MSRPSEPFNAEERDLAERLARLGGPREPAPALDAKILAMARAAVDEPVVAPVAEPMVATTATTGTGGDAPVAPATSDPKVSPLKSRPRKPTPRWPLGLSLAASLVLAAGIGWKLHDNGAGIDEGTTEAAVAAAESEDATQIIMVEPRLQREPPPPPPPMESPFDSPMSADAAVAPAASAARAAPAAPATKPARAKEAPQNMAYSSEAAMDAPPPPAVMSAPAPVAQAKEEAEQDSYDRIDVSGSRIRRTERDVGAAEYTRREQEVRRRQAVAERAAGVVAPAMAPPPAAPPPPVASSRGDNGRVGNTAATRDTPKATADYDDRPPVSADSPEFRDAWLQRIRELLAKGEQAWARESLREFKRRYPDAELPEDLKPLAATLTAP